MIKLWKEFFCRYGDFDERKAKTAAEIEEQKKKKGNTLVEGLELGQIEVEGVDKRELAKDI